MAGMAAAAFRLSAPDASLVVAAEVFGRTQSFVDPDLIGLGCACVAEYRGSSQRSCCEICAAQR